MKNIAPQKRLVALVLAYFFGFVGAHRFYVEKKKSATIQLGLLLGALLLGLFFIIGEGANISFARILPILAFISIIILGIWVFIDFIMIALGQFKNNKGQKLIEWT